ncbi:MAG: ribonuclease HI [Dictyoglomus turgidum]
MSTNIEVFFDGACEPFNPGGVATWGYVVVADGKVMKQDYGLACEPYSKQATNNFAEYTALIKAMQFCIENGYKDITVKGDSQLVIRQMTGEYSVRSQNILPLYQQAQELAQKLGKINFVWIRREENSKADALSKQAYKSYIETKK